MTTVEATTVHSYCRICEALCGISVDVEDGQVVKIRGDDDHPVSKGYLCPKGAAMGRVNSDPDRILHPMKRVGGPGDFARVTWEEALGDIGARLKTLRNEHGPDSLAMYFGNPTVFSSAHVNWAMGFMASYGSRNVYSAGSQDTFARQVASHHLYGNAHVWPFPDIPRSQFVLLLGTNPYVSHGSLLTLPRIKDELRGVRDRGGRVVVVDPARTKTAQAFEHVPIRPGTDAWLLAAMVKVIIDESLGDDEILATEDGVRLAAAVNGYSPDRVADVTGIPAATIIALARDFAAADRAVAHSRCGLGRNPTGTLATFLVDALCIVTGNFDVPGGLALPDFPVDTAGMLRWSGHASFGEKRSRIGNLRNVTDLMPWVLPREIETDGPGRVRSLIVTAGNPLVSAPDGARFEAALARLDLMVGIDFYINETNRHAHYVLPPPTFLEHSDVLMFGGEHMPRVWMQATLPAVAPPPDVREEWTIFEELSRRVGIDAPSQIKAVRLASRMGLRLTPRSLHDLIIRTSSVGDWYGLRRRGLSLKKLEAEPHGRLIRENCRTGRARHHLRTPGRRPRLGASEVLDQLLRLDDYAPARADETLRLIGRRELSGINSWMHNIGRTKEPKLHVHPDDAEVRGLDDGDAAILRSATGAVEVIVEVTDTILRGTVSYPHGYGHAGGSWKQANAVGGANINVLASSSPEDFDPLSGAAHLDGIEVEVLASCQ